MALDDAGLSPKDVDGTVKYSLENTFEHDVARNLGIPNLRYFGDVAYGGGAGCAAVGHAAMAIATGVAETVVVWRARNRGSGGRPWATRPSNKQYGEMHLFPRRGKFVETQLDKEFWRYFRRQWPLFPTQRLWGALLPLRKHFGLFANLACMLFYLIGPFFVNGMSWKEPYAALVFAALWGAYGLIYFKLNSNKKGKAIYVEKSAAEKATATA